MTPKRYTTAEAADELGVDESLVRRYCRQGLLGERIGRNFSITAAQLRKFASVPRKPGRKAKRRAKAAA